MTEPSAGGGGKRALAVFTVVERDNRPSIWIRVGSAFTNRDGSINVVLDAFPVGNNRLQIREQRAEDAGRNGHPGVDPSARAQSERADPSTRADWNAPTGAPCPELDAEARP